MAKCILYFLWLYNEFFIILCNILIITELDCCQIIILSIYICTIYTRLDTCLMTICRFSFRDKVTLRLLKLYFDITDVVEWSRALDIRLSDWCCSVSMVWVQIPSREEQQFVCTAQRSNSNTLWFNFQTYIYILGIYCKRSHWKPSQTIPPGKSPCEKISTIMKSKVNVFVSCILYFYLCFYLHFDVFLCENLQSKQKWKCNIGTFSITSYKKTKNKTKAITI